MQIRLNLMCSLVSSPGLLGCDALQCWGRTTSF